MGRVVSPTPTPLSSGRVVPALVASYDMHGRAVGLFYTQPTGQLFLVTFSQCSQWIWMKLSILPQFVSLLKLMVKLFHKVNVQGRELYLGVLIKCTFNIGLHFEHL